MSKLADLRDFLLKLSAGLVNDVRTVEGLLIDSWDELDGHDSGGMQASKLLNRTENMLWKLPVLEFEIERHGAIFQGSVYGSVQKWRVDVQKATADCAVNEKARVLVKRDQPLKVEPIAEEIETLILEGKNDKRLRWLSPTCVRLEIGKIIPATKPQTTLARRKRFQNALEENLNTSGWQKVPGKLNTFEQIKSIGSLR